MPEVATQQKAAPLAPCTADEDNFIPLLIEKYDCNLNEPCAVCLASYSGDISDRLAGVTDLFYFDGDLIESLYPS